MLFPWAREPGGGGGSSGGNVPMSGARRMAGVAVATPTSLLPHQHFTLLPLLAAPKAHQIYTFNVLGHTIFENDSPPIITCPPNFEPWGGGGGRRPPIVTVLSLTFAEYLNIDLGELHH